MPLGLKLLLIALLCSHATIIIFTQWFFYSSFSIEAHSNVTDVSGHFPATSLLDPCSSCCFLCPALGLRTSSFSCIQYSVKSPNIIDTCIDLGIMLINPDPCSFPFLTNQSMSNMLGTNIYTWENKALFDPTLICKVVLTTLKAFCVSAVSGEILALLADYVSF